uniref:Bifunctional coenzyme A synthase n=1 Tax=Phallusia mammillata TaxID=59560 RepID=A0A6F9DAB2_9ASCI|nr:bifunctional coenzyme A synthase [Phallusia mammillata]
MLKMHRSGILVLTKHVSSLCHGDVVKHIVAGVKKVVSSTLYVHVENASSKSNACGDFNPNDADILSRLLQGAEKVDVQPKNVPEEFSPDVFPFLWKFYSEAASQCHGLDVNILLHTVGCKNPAKHQLYRPIQCIMADLDSRSQEVCQLLQKFVSSNYNYESPVDHKLPVIEIADYSKMDFSNTTNSSPKQPCNRKGSIVLGGTFDHVHTGHKLLLSEATLLADKRILIGITDAGLLKRKILSELIKPWEQRKIQVEHFLRDIANIYVNQPSEKHPANSKLLEIVQIEDPIGPAGTDPNLQCIVVSKETEKGGHVVNEERLKNGLNPLYVHVITGGVLDTDVDLSKSTNESKVSSSTLRFAMLGTLLRAPNTRTSTSNHPEGAYVIGLTGGIASGKTAIGQRLAKLGATVIDCDKLGHKAYEPGTLTFEKVVKRFGSDIVDKSGAINRGILASKVFSGDDKKTNLQDLNHIVWPEIERLAKIAITETVGQHQSQKLPKPVCILDAAVLLEAGWDKFTEEVWVSVVPPSEAVKRVMERDGRTEEDAENRLRSQITNAERVKKAHVVLSTLWAPEVTQKQVEKAWTLLSQRMQPDWNYTEATEESKL